MTMQLLSLTVVVLVLPFPTPAGAQSVKMADLIGTWIATDTTVKGEPEGLLAFRADSSYFWWGAQITDAPQPIPYQRLWQLKGDTLWLIGSPSHTLTLKNQQLTLASLYNKNDKNTYTRGDAPKPPTLVHVQSVTDLAGTWIRPWSAVTPDSFDSLFIGTDSTFIWRSGTGDSSWRQRHNWRLQALSGDTIMTVVAGEYTAPFQVALYTTPSKDQKLQLTYSVPRANPDSTPNPKYNGWYKSWATTGGPWIKQSKP